MGSPTRTIALIMGVLLTVMLTNDASAQGTVYRWVTPAGGDYQTPGNWTPKGVPVDGDTAIFDLEDQLIVSTDIFESSDGLGNIAVPNSDLKLRILGFNKSSLSISTLEIGGQFGTTDSPGRFTALGDSTDPIAASFRADEMFLGGGYRASKFSSEPFSTFDVLSTVQVQPNATLEFLLDAQSELTFYPRLQIGGSKATSNLRGTLDVGPNKSEIPPVGSVNTLIAGDISFVTDQGFPALELVVLRPVRGRQIQIEASQPVQGEAEIRSVVDFADEVSSIDLSDESSLGSPPTSLDAADLSSDGRDDLIVLLADGTLQIYPSTSAGFGTPVAYAIGNDPRDVSTGDFDDDGTIDVAVVCDGDDTLRFFFNPNDDPTTLVTGPIEVLDDDPVGSASSTFTTSPPFSFVRARGVSVTTKGSSGGRITGYVTNGGTVTKLGSNTDVGDDPGTTDPIDDEGKKDDSAPIGVGGVGAASGLDRGTTAPAFFIFDIVDDGAGYPFELTGSLPLSGYAIDFASADVDRDTVTEVFVLTEAGQLDLLQVGVSVRRSVGSFDVDGTPTAIAIAQLEGDAAPDDPLEVVIGLDSPPRIDIYRISRSFTNPNVAGGGFLTGRYVFELALSRDLSDTPLDVVASDALAAGEDGEVYLGVTGGGGSSVNIGDYEAAPLPECAFADLDENGFVGGFDLSILLGSWGPCSGCPADINRDGIVNAADIGLLFSAWGPCDY